MSDPLKARIQELVPDVMEVQFGCGFELVGYSRFQAELFKRFRTKYYVYDGQSKLLCEHGSLNFDDMYLFNKDKWVIVGSPITLAVVLRAIKQNTIIYGDLPADMQLLNMQRKYGEVAGRWNLKADNYDQQSEECKQFIGSLLGIID
jgi:hypothetical protein